MDDGLLSACVNLQKKGCNPVTSLVKKKYCFFKEAWNAKNKDSKPGMYVNYFVTVELRQVHKLLCIIMSNLFCGISPKICFSSHAHIGASKNKFMHSIKIYFTYGKCVVCILLISFFLNYGYTRWNVFCIYMYVQYM